MTESKTSATAPATRVVPPWARLAVTLALLVAVDAIPSIPLPGVDASGLPPQMGRSLGVFALGLVPFLSGALLVELAALVVPPWRALRHGGPEGRAKLGRAALFVTLALCLFQAFGITRLLESLAATAPIGAVSTPLVILTLTAGTFLLGVLAHVGGTYGLANGLVLLVAADPLVQAIHAAARGELPPAQALGRHAAAVAAVALATWAVLRAQAARAHAPDRGRSYRVSASEEREAIAIPAPAAGLAPLAAAMVIVSAPTALSFLGPLARLRPVLADEMLRDAVVLVLVAVFGFVFAYLFNAPHRVAALAARAGSHRTSVELEADARACMRAAALQSILYAVVLFAIGRLASRALSTELAVATACATAIVLDIVAEWRARRRTPDLVPVWPEHRPYALAAARAVLADADIAAHARGESLRRLLQFGGPYAPIELMVARADAPRAAELLRELLLFRRTDEVAAKNAPARAPRRWTRADAIVLGLALVVSGGTLAMSRVTDPARSTTERHAPARPDALRLLPVDDDASVLDPAPRDLPRGVSLQSERVPLGPGRMDEAHYARVVRGDGETLDQARARLLAWASQLVVPPGDAFLVAPVSETDETTGHTEPIGWRTYLVKTEPIIDGLDVVDARAISIDSDFNPGAWAVSVKLGPEGARRFDDYTAANTRRRLAIVVDGVVESAPVIVSEIRGGMVQITMGAGDAEQQARDARKLEGHILGR